MLELRRTVFVLLVAVAVAPLLARAVDIETHAGDSLALSMFEDAVLKAEEKNGMSVDTMNFNVLGLRPCATAFNCVKFGGGNACHIPPECVLYSRACLGCVARWKGGKGCSCPKDRTPTKFGCCRPNPFQIPTANFQKTFQKKDCRKRPHFGRLPLPLESEEECFGGVGSGCAGIVPQLHINPPTVKSSGTEIDVSVGSILHDRCCVFFPYGYMCRGYYEYFSKADNCACLLEWHKATWNSFNGRTWRHTFPAGTDLTPVNKKRWWRRSYLPWESHEPWASAPSGANPHYEHFVPFIYPDVVSTTKLCAPEGTPLDCPNEASGCRVGKYKWGIIAGDSIFCRSGRFKRILNGGATSRYGICSKPSSPNAPCPTR